MPENNILVDTVMPVNLSRAIAQATASGYNLDVDVAGIPFLMKPSPENPWVHQVREDKRDQFDNSREAGEQSFGYWWLRSQSSFHGGAGQLFSDSGTVDPEISRIRFNESTTMNLFSNPGNATPLSGNASTAITTAVRGVPFVRGGVNKLAIARGNNDSVDFYNVSPFAFDTNVSLTEAASVCLDIATDGERLFVAINGKIIRVNESGAQTDIATLTFTKPVRLAWVKQRLMLAHGPDVYEVNPDPAATVALGTANRVFSHKAPGWQWSAIAESPTGIFLAGYAGLTGEIYSIGETESSNTLVLGPAILQITLPTGEVPYDLFFYVNSLFVVGTSEGARVGSFTPDGRPQFGPVSFDLAPVRAVGALGPTAVLGADTGVYLLDLGQVVDRSGKFAYAHHHTKVSGAAQNYVSIMTSGSIGAPLIFSLTTNHLEREDGDSGGELLSSWFTWGTTELKRVYHIVLGGKLPTAGSFPSDTMVVTVENYEGDTVAFNIGADASRTTWTYGVSLDPSVAYRVRIQLKTGTGTNIINSVQLKAQPQDKRYETVVLPLLIADSEKTSGGRVIGYPNFAVDRLKTLMLLAKNNTTVVVVNRVTDESYQAQIQDVQFRQELGITAAPGKKIAGAISLALRVTV